VGKTEVDSVWLINFLRQGLGINVSLAKPATCPSRFNWSL